MPRDGRKRFLLVELSLGRAAEVRRQHESRAPAERLPDAGKGGADARVVADPFGLRRNIEVDTHENPLAAQIDFGHFQNGHEPQESEMETPIPRLTSRSSARLWHPTSGC